MSNIRGSNFQSFTPTLPKFEIFKLSNFPKVASNVQTSSFSGLRFRVQILNVQTFIFSPTKACFRGSYFFCAKELVVCTSWFLDPGSLSNRPLCLQLAFGHAWSLGSSAASLISGSSLAVSLLSACL